MAHDYSRAQWTKRHMSDIMAEDQQLAETIYARELASMRNGDITFAMAMEQHERSTRKTDEEVAIALAEDNRRAQDQQLAENYYAKDLASVRNGDITFARAMERYEGRSGETDKEVAMALVEEDNKRTQSRCLNDEKLAMDVFAKEIEYIVQLDRDRDLAEFLHKESIDRQAEKILMAPALPDVVRPNVQSFQQDQPEPSPDESSGEDALRIPDDLDDYEALLELGEQIGDAKECRLPESHLNSLPVQAYKSNDGGASSEPSDRSQCSVCREDFVDGQDLRMLPCFHKYHKECIDAWLQAKSKCPICNLDLKEEFEMNLIKK